MLVKKYLTEEHFVENNRIKKAKNYEQMSHTKSTSSDINFTHTIWKKENCIAFLFPYKIKTTCNISKPSQKSVTKSFLDNISKTKIRAYFRFSTKMCKNIFIQSLKLTSSISGRAFTSSVAALLWKTVYITITVSILAQTIM